MRTYSIINYENLYLFVMYCKAQIKIKIRWYAIQIIDIKLFLKMVKVQAAFEWMIWDGNVFAENECR